MVRRRLLQRPPVHAGAGLDALRHLPPQPPHPGERRAPAGRTDESYALLLRAAGYATAYVGKTHFGSDRPGTATSIGPRRRRCAPAGFDYVHQVPGPMALAGRENHLTRRWEELGLLERYREDYRRRAADPGAGAWASPLPAEEFARHLRRGPGPRPGCAPTREPRPFLLVVGFGGPHPPFDAPEPYASRYRPEDLPAPIPAGEPGDWLPEHVRRYMERLSGGDRRGESTPGRPSGGGGGAHLPAADGQLRGQDRPDRRPRGAPPGRPGRAGLDGEHPGDLPLRPRGDGGRPRALPQVRLLRVLGAHPVRHALAGRGAGGGPQPARRAAGSAAGGAWILVEQLDLFATVVDAGGAAPSRRAFARSLLPLARGRRQAPGEGGRGRGRRSTPS